MYHLSDLSDCCTILNILVIGEATEPATFCCEGHVVLVLNAERPPPRPNTGGDSRAILVIKQQWQLRRIGEVVVHTLPPPHRRCRHHPFKPHTSTVAAVPPF